MASNLNYDYVTKLHFFDEQNCYTNPIVQLLCDSSTDEFILGQADMRWFEQALADDPIKPKLIEAILINNGFIRDLQIKINEICKLYAESTAECHLSLFDEYIYYLSYLVIAKTATNAKH